jgi:hypothetical protein
MRALGNPSFVFCVPSTNNALCMWIHIEEEEKEAEARCYHNYISFNSSSSWIHRLPNSSHLHYSTSERPTARACVWQDGGGG